MTWTNSPQYLKGIQKIRAMSPEKKAVTQTIVNELSSMYAGDDMRKQLQAMNAAATEKARDRSYELGKRKLDLSETLGTGELDLVRKGIKYAKDEGRTSEALGYGNIALSGLFGLADMREKQKRSKSLNDLIKKMGA